VLVGVGGQRTFTAALPPGKSPGMHCTGGWDRNFSAKQHHHRQQQERRRQQQQQQQQPAIKTQRKKNY